MCADFQASRFLNDNFATERRKRWTKSQLHSIGIKVAGREISLPPFFIYRCILLLNFSTSSAALSIDAVAEKFLSLETVFDDILLPVPGSDNGSERHANQAGIRDHNTGTHHTVTMNDRLNGQNAPQAQADVTERRKFRQVFRKNRACPLAKRARLCYNRGQ